MAEEWIEEITNPALEAKRHAESGAPPAALSVNALADTHPKLLAFVVAQSKKAGNDAFQDKRYRGAHPACTRLLHNRHTLLRMPGPSVHFASMPHRTSGVQIGSTCSKRPGKAT